MGKGSSRQGGQDLIIDDAERLVNRIDPAREPSKSRNPRGIRQFDACRSFLYTVGLPLLDRPGVGRRRGSVWSSLFQFAAP
jgi:hypothetical protein